MGAFKRFSKTLSLRTSSSFRSSNNNNNSSTKRSSSTSSKKLIPKKSVSFSDEISSLHHVERFDNSTGDLWFTKLEELAFKQRDFDLCNMSSIMPNLDDIESQLGESCRGLEYHLNEYVQRQIALRRQTSLHAVLHTQDKCRRSRRNGAQQQQQQQPKDSSVKTISRAYSMVSQSATKYAIGIAKQDEKDVSLWHDDYPQEEQEEEQEEQDAVQASSPFNSKEFILDAPRRKNKSMLHVATTTRSPIRRTIQARTA